MDKKYEIGVFDLLKNKSYDMTTSVVQCLNCKTVSSIWKSEDKGHDKN